MASALRNRTLRARVDVHFVKASLGLALCAVSFAGGCTEPSTSDAADVPDVAEVEEDSYVEFEPLVVTVESTAEEGNVPLKATLSCSVEGEAPEALGYEWTIESSTAKLPSLDWTFTSPGDKEVCCTAFRTIRPDERFKDCQYIRVRNSPALSVSEPILTGPSEVAPGACLNVAITVTNVGGRVVNPMKVGCALSKDDTWAEESASSRIDIWSADIESIKDGKSLPQKIEYVAQEMCIPAETAEAGYFLICKVDSLDQLDEDDRSDNEKFFGTLITIDAKLGLEPDLTVETLSLQTGQSFPKTWGETVNYQLAIRNAGGGESSQFNYRVQACPEGKSAGDPTCVNTNTGVTGKPEDYQVFKLSGLVTLPIQRGWPIPNDTADGRYCFHASVDTGAAVLEKDETNNKSTIPACFDVQFKAPVGSDLNLIQVACKPTEAAWNGTLAAEFVVRNDGTTVTPKWDYEVLLSSSEAPTSLSSKMCTSTSGCTGQAGLALGEERSVTAVLKISNEIPLKDYFCFVKVDDGDVLDEIDESNNIRKSDQKVTIASKAFTDVYAKAVTHTPLTQKAGQTIDMGYTLGNQNTSTAAGVTVCAVLSQDDKIQVADITSKKDIIIASEIIAELRPDSKLTPEEKEAQVKTWTVTLPIELDHTTTTYTVGVLADCKGALGDDTNKTNNGVASTSGKLVVEDAKGGCFEDASEPNVENAPSALGIGLTENLGLCDDGDHFAITAPKGNTLTATIIAEPILAINAVPSDLLVELRDPAGELVDAAAVAAGTVKVIAYVVPADGTFKLSVKPAKAKNQAHYDAEIRIDPPVPGVDLVPAELLASPETTFPGGALHLDWKVVNGGDTAVTAFKLGVYASTDDQLDVNTDRRIGEVAFTGLSAATAEKRLDIVVLPADLAGGDVSIFAVIDDQNTVTEVNETNNTGLAGAVFVDAANKCEDDVAYEPNNTLATATLLPSTTATYSSLGVCPDLEDWYRVDLQPGQKLTALVEYKYASKAGYVYVQIHDRNGIEPLIEGKTASKATATLPYVWDGGAHYVRVFNEKPNDTGLPYTYTLTLTVEDGDPKDACLGDNYETNNDWKNAATTGCGLRKATLCLRDTDWYTFTLPASSNVSATLTNSGSDLKITLYTDPTTKELSKTAGNGTLAISSPATGPTTYYLAVQPKSTTYTGIDSFNYDLFFDGLLGVDLEVEDVKPATGGAFDGEDEVVGFRLVNQCLDPVPVSEFGVYLSADDALDTADTFIAVRPTPGTIAAGSFIDVAQKFTIPVGTTPGLYSIFVVADPNDQISESNEDNNDASAPFLVQQICVDDASEPNNAPSYAPVVAPGLYEGLAVCPLDVDWYGVELDAGQALGVVLDFKVKSGDLDLRLYSTGNVTTPVAKAFETADGETLTFTAVSAGKYWVRVNGLSGASNTYDMRIDVVDCGDGLCGVAAGESCDSCPTDCGAVVCDDGNPCTDDACGPSACVNSQNLTLCPDGGVCNIVGTCVTESRESLLVALPDATGPNVTDRTRGSDTLTVSGSGCMDGVGSVTVTVELAFGATGDSAKFDLDDYDIFLTAPGASEPIYLGYGSDSFIGLNDFDGETADGEWTIGAEDAKQNFSPSGLMTGWTLQIECK